MSSQLQQVQAQLYSETVNLLQLLVHLYYDDYTIILINTLCQLDKNNRNNVTEKDLVNELPLTNKQIRYKLYQLYNDGLINHVTRIINSNTTDTNKHIQLDIKTSRSHIRKDASNQYVWYIDSERLCNTIKYKHYKIIVELNKQTNYTEQYYYCPNPSCPNYNTNFALFDLLFDQSHHNNSTTSTGVSTHTDHTFTCTQCKYYSDDKQVWLPTVLQMRTDNNFLHISTINEQLRHKFNTQLQPLFDQLNVVNELLSYETQLNNNELLKYQQIEYEKLLNKNNKQYDIAAQYRFQENDTNNDTAVPDTHNTIIQSNSNNNTTAASNAGIGAPSTGIVINKKPKPNVDINKRKQALPWARYTPPSDNNMNTVNNPLDTHDTANEIIKKRKIEQIDDDYAEQYKNELLHHLRQQQAILIKQEQYSDTANIKHECNNNNQQPTTHIKQENNNNNNTTTQPVIKAESNHTMNEMVPDNTQFTVQGEVVPFSLITTDHIGMMTEDEQTLYFEHATI